MSDQSPEITHVDDLVLTDPNPVVSVHTHTTASGHPATGRPDDYSQGLLDAAQIVRDCAEQGLGLSAAERAIQREVEALTLPAGGEDRG